MPRVGFGSISEVGARNREVCFTPNTGRCRQGRPCPKGANFGSDPAPLCRETRIALNRYRGNPAYFSNSICMRGSIRPGMD
jgi:hypothetical protein